VNLIAEPVISTIVLNWNRVHLLQQTLESYLETVAAPHEVFVVDNGSSDGSQEVIKRFCKDYPVITPILLESNEGGHALNRGLALSRGTLLHISENDVEYLPGWTEKVTGAFKSFPELGQLSLFGPVPSDDEAWDLKPCSMRYRRDQIIYVTEHNVGTSSVIRRAVWDNGIRIHNYPTKEGSFLFPDDGRLSREIRDVGLWVAWAREYLARNSGHMGQEIENHPEYYLENYRSKDWFGIEALEKRMERWHSQVRPVRQSFLYGNAVLSGEKSFPSQECNYPQRWSMIDGNTAEVETLEFLYSLVRLLKPNLVVETGTWHGHSAVAMGKALRQNGFGRIISFEVDPEISAVAERKVEDEGLLPYVEIRNESSLSAVIPDKIDILLLDSELPIRGAEFEYFRARLRHESIVIFHDTSTIHGTVRADVNKFIAQGTLKGMVFPTPRGLAICEYREM
jgi:predicted O-methyltransferase YrrM